MFNFVLKRRSTTWGKDYLSDEWLKLNYGKYLSLYIERQIQHTYIKLSNKHEYNRLLKHYSNNISWDGPYDMSFNCIAGISLFIYERSNGIKNKSTNLWLGREDRFRGNDRLLWFWVKYLYVVFKLLLLGNSASYDNACEIQLKMRSDGLLVITEEEMKTLCVTNIRRFLTFRKTVKKTMFKLEIVTLMIPGFFNDDHCGVVSF